MNGALRKHGKTIGYIVEEIGSSDAVCCACHGLNDPKRVWLAMASRVTTVFPTRRKALKAINDTRKDRPERQFLVHRVASLVK